FLVRCFFFFQAEDGIRDYKVTGFRRVLFRSPHWGKSVTKTGVIDYIQKGGLLMWPILGCSIISIAVFAERLFYLHRATIHVGEFLKGLSNLIRRRNFAEALHESAGTPGPVARVIHAAIIRHDAPRAR